MATIQVVTRYNTHMPGFTDSYENTLLNHVFRNGAYTPPTTVYIGVFTATPTDSAAGTEVSGGAYARQAVTFGAAASGSVTNSAVVEFPAATAAWGTVTSMGIFDAPTAGALIVYGNLTASVTIGVSDILRFAAGAITVSLD